jgi:uncharacterized protein YceK
MIRSVALIAVLFSLVGCGSIKRTTAQITGYSKTCVDGVSYIQFASGVTVQYDREGKVVRCGS